MGEEVPVSLQFGDYESGGGFYAHEAAHDHKFGVIVVDGFIGGWVDELLGLGDVLGGEDGEDGFLVVAVFYVLLCGLV